MDKTRISFYRILPTLLLLLFLSAAGDTRAKKMQMINGYCGVFYRQMDHLFRQKQVDIDFYRFRPKQILASIGARCGHWEAAYAAASDSVHFYLQDIDTVYFNPRQTGFAWHYYDSLRGKPMTATYQMVLGTATETGLPDNTFDKIMIINSFHEFTEKEGMLADISGKLNQNGILYIDEAVPVKSGQKHGVCKMLMLLPEELISLLETNGYRYLNSLDIGFRSKRMYRKIYAFSRR